MAPKQKTPTQELFDLPTCEQLTSVSRNTWRAWAQRGVVSSVKLGDRVLIPRKEIDRLIMKGYRPSLEEQVALRTQGCGH